MDDLVQRAAELASAYLDGVDERLVELFGLPSDASVGFTSGGTMANFTALAAARHAVLRDAGWDVEERGLIGAPEVHLLAGEESHATAYGSLQLLGLGRGRAHRI